MNENTNYVKSINGYPIEDEEARTQIETLANEVDEKITSSENELKVEIANTYATLEGLATTDTKIDTTKDAILLQVSNTYETKDGTDTKIASAIEQSAEGILSTVSETYATENELTSAVSTINQRASNIESTVATKVGEDEVISKINQSAETIGISANKVDLTGKQIDLTGDNVTITSTNFSVDANGNISATNADLNNVDVTGGDISLTSNYGSTSKFKIEDDRARLSLWGSRMKITDLTRTDTTKAFVQLETTLNSNDELNTFSLSAQGYGNDQTTSYYMQMTPESLAIDKVTAYTSMSSPVYNNTSLAAKKKNFEKFENALDIIKDIDIYKFNYKEEKDDTKKHIGLVIGDEYKYSDKITNNNNDSVDLYSFISVCCKAIQEQQKEIEELKAILNK